MPGHDDDPRVKRTRQLLQQAFTDLMREKSFQAISVQDIAERATVNRATFYAHFDDKFALIDYCMRDQFRQMLAQRLVTSRTLTPRALRDLFLVVCEYITLTHSDCHPADMQFDLFFENVVQQEVATVLHGWIATSTPSVPADRPLRDTVPTVVSWSLLGAVMEWHKAGAHQPAGALADQVIGVLMEGVRRVIPPG